MANNPTRPDPDRTRGANIPVEHERDTNKGQARTASGLNVLLGLWLIISPWILGYTAESASWNAIIVGALVAIIGAIRLFTPVQTAWLSWVTVVLGLWLLVAPWILGYNTQAATWNSIIVGVLVAALGAWSALAPRPSAEDHRHRAA